MEGQNTLITGHEVGGFFWIHIGVEWYAADIDTTSPRGHGRWAQPVAIRVSAAVCNKSLITNTSSIWILCRCGRWSTGAVEGYAGRQWIMSCVDNRTCKRPSECNIHVAAQHVSAEANNITGVQSRRLMLTSKVAQRTDSTMRDTGRMQSIHDLKEWIGVESEEARTASTFPSCYRVQAAL